MATFPVDAPPAPVMAKPASDFVIVPRAQQPRRWRWLLALAWILSLLACAWGVHRWSVPALGRALGELDRAEQEQAALREQLEALLREKAVLERSDQIHREALTRLQETLAEREEELAALRADVAFYERLVGGSARQKGLAVHSVHFEPLRDGRLRYEITLSQNLKTSAMTEGSLSFSIEGRVDGRPQVLEWAKLDPAAEGRPRTFSFRYFQQIKGSILLPPEFRPERVRLRIQRKGSEVEKTIPWEETKKPAGA